MIETAMFLGCLALLVVGFLWFERRREARSAANVREAAEIGTHIPVSLHPYINPDICIGTAACEMVCPESTVLEVVNGKAYLAHASECIGHGACAEACPVKAITLVFGTSQRGIDIPSVSKTFESNVPGVYIAGELGGMGLIRNAVRQGEEAAEYIHASLQAEDTTTPGTAPTRNPALPDLAIVGAGPAGISAAARARELGRSVVMIEPESPGGTVLQYPRHKIVMTAPFRLPGYGEIKRATVAKEEILAILQKAFATSQARHERLRMHALEPATAQHRAITVVSEPTADGSVHRVAARRVLLAIGRRGNPKTLGIPGEKLPIVTYRSIDGWQYAGKRVLIVGGGDSALEACFLVLDGGGHPILSYRRDQITRAKRQNRSTLDRYIAEKKIDAQWSTEVVAIGANGSATLRHSDGRESTIAIDYVIIQAGGDPPSAILKRAGIHIETKYGTA